VVIARKSGDPDLEVAVTNTLEQKSTFNALGATSGAVAQVTRQGAEFMRVDESIKGSYCTITSIFLQLLTAREIVA
jgi:hypothetical protein